MKAILRWLGEEKLDHNVVAVGHRVLHGGRDLTKPARVDDALIATLRSTPDAIRPEVTHLVARLRARWGTEDALRAFAGSADLRQVMQAAERPALVTTTPLLQSSQRLPYLS